MNYPDSGALWRFKETGNLRARAGKEILLPDGVKLRLRELRPDDRVRLQAFLARCSAESIRARFFRPLPEFSDALLDQLMTLDERRRVLLATRGEGEQEEIVAEGRAVAEPERPQVADVAFLVQDEQQRRGIATALLKELTVRARRKGFTHFSADVLADNWAMRALIRKTGRLLSSTISYGVIHFEIPLTCNDAAALPRAARSSATRSARYRC